MDNTQKKAGALNQVLKRLLPGLGDNDVVMIMDADTRLDDGFLAAAVDRFSHDRALMAVGGLFYGEDGHGLIGQFQRNEYLRYSREIGRRRGRVFVLTGTASMFRPRALRTVAESRGASIPGTPGDVYDTAALTEDNELTIALKSLGGLMVSPAQCTVVTELMPSWCTLWAQRLRWQRGRAREHRRLRHHAADPALLGPATGDRLRRDRPGVLPAADLPDGVLAGYLDLVPVLAGAGRPVHGRTGRHGVEGRMAGPASRR